jgi:uncharacterized membrane protein YjfL (UPF0719 family)
MRIPTLGLNITSGFLFIVAFATIFTILTHFREHKEIKKQEARLSIEDKTKLYANRVVHFSSTIFVMFFPYIFKSENIMNILYVLYLGTVNLSWYIFKECPITAMEKKILDNKYKNGEMSVYEPYTTLLCNPSNHNESWMIQKSIIIMFYVNLALVSYRIYIYYK